MTATDELRRLLDERGVEWWAEDDPEDPPYYLVTKWFSNANEQTFEEIPAIRSRSLKAFCITPEQAIEATLGRDECRNVCNSISEFTCSACGFNCDLTSWISLFDGDDGRHRHHHHGVPNFCPNCGLSVKR